MKENVHTMLSANMTSLTVSVFPIRGLASRIKIEKMTNLGQPYNVCRESALQDRNDPSKLGTSPS